MGRVINANQTPDWSLTPYILQALLLLLGPPFFAASIYMILGRVIRLLEADHHSFIRATWMTKILLLEMSSLSWRKVSVSCPSTEVNEEMN